MVALVVGHEASFIGTSYGGREKKNTSIGQLKHIDCGSLMTIQKLGLEC